jgi:acyl dehydratase
VTWPAVGAEIPPLEREMTSDRMVAYGGATWDWHRLHHDAAFAAGRGLEAPIVDGQLFGALLAQALQDWLGPEARIAELSFRFRQPVLVGQWVRCEGSVTERLHDGVRCDLRVVALEVPGGPATFIAVEPASARVRGRT